MESERLCIIQAAVQKRQPVCVFGIPGCGKSRLIDLAWAQTHPEQSVKHAGPVSVNIDDSLDAKTLVGFFRSSQTEVGRFEWVDGLLVELMRKGRWLVFEDIDKVSADILSILPRPGDLTFHIPEIDTQVPIHPDFAILGTMSITVNRAALKRSTRNIPSWLMVECPPPSNLTSMVASKLPPHVADLVVSTYSSLIDFSSKLSSAERKFGLHDLFKLVDRVHAKLPKLSLNTDSPFITEYQRVQIGRDFVDLFAAHAFSTDRHSELVTLIEDTLECGTGSLIDSFPAYADSDPHHIRIGDTVVARKNLSSTSSSSSFTLTSVHSRIMQSIATASLINSEAVLCVGDTGTGKTTTIQFLANQIGAKIFVYNFSDQTEAADLIGRLKPVMNIDQLVTDCSDLLHKYVDEKTSKSATDVLSYINKKLAVRDIEGVIKAIEKTALKVIQMLEQKSLPANPWQTLLGKCKSAGKVFSFVEGPLVQAARSGDWILLDEINLAPSDVLRILNGIIENKTIVIPETGEEIRVHPEFRLFAAMNPPNLGRGKKSLPDSLRSRFTEIYCEEILARYDLVKIVHQSLERDFPVSTLGKIVPKIVDLYLELKTSVSAQLSSLEGGAPVFSLRSLSRAMEFAKRLLRSPKRSVAPTGAAGDGVREIVDGLKVSLTSSIDARSEEIVVKKIDEIFATQNMHAISARSDNSPEIVSDESTGNWVQIEGHWIAKGSEKIDSDQSPCFIATPSVRRNLKKFSICLAGGVSARPPILCEGPTGAGKTSIISFIARISGHKLVRINNHEHTDLQDYFGQYVSSSSGSLRFQEGPLVSAVRNGWWVLLDELNLAPTEVLEALNRLLDDNRELIVPETNEVVKAHPDFVLFASQNPVTLEYAGRKSLSRAFRNRFIEIQVDELPATELGVILGSKCRIAESTATRMLTTYVELSRLRRLDRVLSGRDSALVTVRDLLRWAMRSPTTREEIALEGYLVLAERLRTEDQKSLVISVLETKIGVKNLRQLVANFYESESAKVYERCASEFAKSGLVRTRALDRVLALVSRSVFFGESILLVGETGTGKTTAVQLVADLAKTNLRIINCHQHLESSDLLGAVGPTTGSGPQLQWKDGPLIESCRSGSWILLDEVNLADDSVVERLNSLLDVDYRAITLAEKPNEETVVAEKNFRLFCTMNPGNDFGKKELSAALRNRFSEIWVPSVEFDLPLSDDSLSWSSGYSMVHSLLGGEDDAARKICAIIRFAIENNLGNATTRDAILWSNFVRHAASSANSQWSSLDQIIAHGGAVVLLDSLESGSEHRNTLTAYFRTIFGDRIVDEVATDSWINLTTTTCGPYPLMAFPDTSISSKFSLKCPTSLRNFGRLVRGMFAGRRPILLEGSPGAGKSSVVMALAAYCGAPICRINFSDQTELGDILGQNIPDITDGKKFVWKDGILLEAISRGEWVLLDELNLAPQPVLEGLNALLDHRAEIYVPCIDRLVKCPPSFRLFATQNEAKKGDGRKMLPRSFLSRFNRVMVDPMGIDDLKIAAVETINSDKHTVEKAVNVLERFSQSKWKSSQVDWNLRDISRLLKCCPLDTARVFLILAQRLTDPSDREKAMEIVGDIFDSRISSIDVSRIITPIAFPTNRDRDLLVSQAPAVAGLALALGSGSHSIITGSSGCGKKSVIHLVHSLISPELPIAELRMHSQMDTSDLIGQFSQNSSSGEFVWIDSVLTKLVRSGGWMVLTNAHCCPPSILDRLNALIEDNGILVIPEKGTAETVVPHAQFRLILSTEFPNKLSHAIRNRCVEIFVDTQNVPVSDLIRIGICAGLLDKDLLVQLASKMNNVREMFVAASLVSTGRVNVETALNFIGSSEVCRDEPGMAIIPDLLASATEGGNNWFESRQLSLWNYRHAISTSLCNSETAENFVSEWFVESAINQEDLITRLIAVTGKPVTIPQSNSPLTPGLIRLIVRVILSGNTLTDSDSVHAISRQVVPIVSRYPTPTLICWEGLLRSKLALHTSPLLFSASFRESSIVLFEKLSLLLHELNMQTRAAILCELAATAVALRNEPTSDSVVSNEVKILKSVESMLPSDEEESTESGLANNETSSLLQDACDRVARLCGVNDIDTLVKCGARIRSSDLVLFGSRRVASWSPEKMHAIELEEMYGALIGLIGQQVDGGKCMNIQHAIDKVKTITVEKVPQVIANFTNLVSALENPDTRKNWFTITSKSPTSYSISQHIISAIPSSNEGLRNFVIEALDNFVSIELSEFDIHADCSLAVADMDSELASTDTEIALKEFCKDVAALGTDGSLGKVWKSQIEQIRDSISESGIFIRSSHSDYDTIRYLFNQVKHELLSNLTNRHVLSRIVSSFVQTMSGNFEKYYADITRPICLELMKVAYGMELLLIEQDSQRCLPRTLSVPVSAESIDDIWHLLEWTRIAEKFSFTVPRIRQRIFDKIESETIDTEDPDAPLIQNDVSISLSSLVQDNDKATAEEAVERLRRQLFPDLKSDEWDMDHDTNNVENLPTTSDWDSIAIALVAANDDLDSEKMLAQFLAQRGEEIMNAISDQPDSPEIVALNRIRLEQVIADLESRKTMVPLSDDTTEVTDSVKDNREMKLRLREFMKKKSIDTIDFYAPNGGAGAVAMIAKPLVSICNFLTHIRDSIMEISDHPDLVLAIAVTEKALNLPATTTSAIAALQAAEHVFVAVEKFQKNVPSRYLSSSVPSGVNELMSIIAQLRANEILSWKDLRSIRETIVAKSNCGKWLVHLLKSTMAPDASVFDLCLAWLRNSSIGQYRFRISLLEIVANMTKNNFMVHAVGVAKLWEKSIEGKIKSAREVLNKEVKALMKEIQFRLGGRHYSHEGFRHDTKRSHIQLAAVLKRFEEEISENCDSFVPTTTPINSATESLLSEINGAMETIRNSPRDKSAKSLKNRIVQDLQYSVREFLKEKLSEEIESLGNREFSGKTVVDEIINKPIVGTAVPHIVARSMVLSQLQPVCKNLDVKPTVIAEWRSVCWWALRLLGETINAELTLKNTTQLAKWYTEALPGTPVLIRGETLKMVVRTVELIEMIRMFVCQGNLLKKGLVNTMIPEIPEYVRHQIMLEKEEIICSRKWLVDELPRILNLVVSDFLESSIVCSFFTLSRNRFDELSREAVELILALRQVPVEEYSMTTVCDNLNERMSLAGTIESVAGVLDFTIFLHNEGLCSQDAEPDEADGDAQKTDWNDGTGLGTGSGMNDKSDEIEDAGQFDTMRGESGEQGEDEEQEPDMSKGIDANKDQGMNEDDVEEHNVEREENEEEEKSEDEGDREMGDVDLDKGGEIDKEQGKAPEDEDEEDDAENKDSDEVHLKNNMPGEEAEEDVRAAEDKKGGEQQGQEGEQPEENEEGEEEGENSDEEDNQFDAVIDPSKMEENNEEDSGNELDDIQSMKGSDGNEDEDDMEDLENGDMQDDVEETLEEVDKLEEEHPSGDQEDEEGDQLNDDAEVGAQDIDASAGGNEGGKDEQQSAAAQQTAKNDSSRAPEKSQSGKSEEKKDEMSSSSPDSAGGEFGRKNKENQQKHKPAPSPLDPNNSDALDEWLKDIRELVGEKEDSKEDAGKGGDVGQMDESAEDVTVAPTTSEVPGGKIDEQEGEDTAADEPMDSEEPRANGVTDEDVVLDTEMEDSVDDGRENDLPPEDKTENSCDSVQEKKRASSVVPDLSESPNIPDDHMDLPPAVLPVPQVDISNSGAQDALLEDEEVAAAESRASRLTTDLSEKLMAVLEPTKRGRLEGFFKTGKRVSMRRVLSWIASDYRKDKFWLRRTKPSHRDYKVVICLDNTLSMKKNDVGELSLVCVSALSQSLQLLEVGKVGVLSFGTEVRDICPLGDSQNHPMTVKELMNDFGFNEESTSSFSDAFPSVIHKCAEEFVHASTSDDSRGCLALIITDGRFDKDRCRPYVQELIAQGHIPVLIVMDSNKDESILSVTSVTFEEEVSNGNKRRKLVRKPFLSQSDCPFPFYAVIQEPSQLPSTLADILKQWIEISSRS